MRGLDFSTLLLRIRHALVHNSVDVELGDLYVVDFDLYDVLTDFR